MPRRGKGQVQNCHQRAPKPPSPPSPQHGSEDDKEEEGSPPQLPPKPKQSKKMPSSVCYQKARSLHLFSSSSDNISNSSNEKCPPAWKGRGSRRGEQGVVSQPVIAQMHHAQHAQKSSLLMQQSINSSDKEGGHSPSQPHLP
eukprot:5084431-Ditylum_brightwellii.AAC.1